MLRKPRKEDSKNGRGAVTLAALGSAFYAPRSPAQMIAISTTTDSTSTANTVHGLVQLLRTGLLLRDSAAMRYPLISAAKMPSQVNARRWQRHEIDLPVHVVLRNGYLACWCLGAGPK